VVYAYLPNFISIGLLCPLQGGGQQIPNFTVFSTLSLRGEELCILLVESDRQEFILTEVES